MIQGDSFTLFEFISNWKLLVFILFYDSVSFNSFEDFYRSLLYKYTRTRMCLKYDLQTIKLKLHVNLSLWALLQFISSVIESLDRFKQLMTSRRNRESHFDSIKLAYLWTFTQQQSSHRNLQSETSSEKSPEALRLTSLLCNTADLFILSSYIMKWV